MTVNDDDVLDVSKLDIICEELVEDYFNLSTSKADDLPGKSVPAGRPF